jgi:hypothetical protein
MNEQPCQATPRAELLRQLLDSRIPKNEREWCAAREIEELRKDKERLDWLARNLVTIHTPTAPDMSGVRYVGQMRNEARGDRGGPSYFRVNHRDLREAIDAAMREGGK